MTRKSTTSARVRLSQMVFLIVALGAMRSLAFETGRLLENVACDTDSTQTYSLYLPTAYDTSKRWPVLLVFDPRGRSVRAAELFLEAAERYGWVIVSSNDTRSDEAWEPNARALRALWPEVHARFATDPRRVYAAGFSGGVLVAWYLAQFAEAPGLAGIIGSGGRPAAEIPVERITFAHFGCAGRLDFNYAEMRLLDELVAARGAPHQFRAFDGRHAWMPAAMAFDAVEWMEVLAMKNGLRKRDPVGAEAIFQKSLAHVVAWNNAGDVLAAARGYRNLIATWEGLRPVAAAKRALSHVESSRAYARQLQEEREAEAFEQQTLDRLSPLLDDLAAARPRGSADDYVERLDIEALLEKTSEDGPRGWAAQRVLERLFARTSFYMARDLVERQEFAAALVSLSIAERIRPRSPHIWFAIARAHALAEAPDEAVRALERAIDNGFRDLRRLENTPAFETLRGHTDYAALLRRLRE